MILNTGDDMWKQAARILGGLEAMLAWRLLIREADSPLIDIRRVACFALGEIGAAIRRRSHGSTSVRLSADKDPAKVKAKPLCTIWLDFGPSATIEIGEMTISAEVDAHS